MNPVYTNDGLHLLGKGYLLWRDIVKPYVCLLYTSVTIAQTSISLLPKPQLYKDTGKNFTMGKVKLSTPVLRSEWEVFIMNACLLYTSRCV